MKVKKYFNNEIDKISFIEIDRKILMGWECNYFSSENKQYLEKIKCQTQSALKNIKFEEFKAPIK